MMNAILSLASVVTPAAALAIVAGGVCPPCVPQACSAPVAAPAAHMALVAAQGAAGAQPESNVNTHVKVVQQDDSGTYELVIENGQPRAKINGEAVPAERIVERADGVWVIEDDNGEALAKFHIGAAPRAPQPPQALRLSPLQDSGRNLRVDPDDPRWQSLPRTRDWTVDPAEQPRTMLGVVMGPAPAQGEGEAESAGVLLDRVIEGLPAERAGLKSGDIVVGIEGAGKATPESLRALLREKAPGDELKVRVLRDGAEKTFMVKLDAFDRDKLVQPDMQNLPPDVGAGAFAGSLHGLSGEARQQMDEALKALREAEQSASGEARRAHEHARQAIEQFVAALERMEAEGLSTGEAMRGDLGRWFGQFKDDQMVWGDKPGMVFTLPRNAPGWPQRDALQNPSAGGSSDTETGSGQLPKTKELEARLNAMSERLERIEKLLEKLTADEAGSAAPAPEGDENANG